MSEDDTLRSVKSCPDAENPICKPEINCEYDNAPITQSDVLGGVAKEILDIRSRHVFLFSFFVLKEGLTQDILYYRTLKTPNLCY